MEIIKQIPILIIVIPLITAIAIPLLGRINRSLCWFITVVVTLLSFIEAYYLLTTVISSGPISYHLGGWAPPWGIEYVVDYLSGLVLVVVSFLAFMVAVYAKSSLEKEIEESKRPFFYSVYMLFFTGLMGMTITGDIFNLYVFIEITSLSAYILVAMGGRREALVASFNYLVLGTIAGTFILIGIGYLYMATGTLNMADLRLLLPALYGSTTVRTAFAFFTVGLSLKIALFPLHTWMPNAYTEAPSSVSALVASTGSKVGAYVLLRIMFTVFTVDFDIRAVPVTKILIILSCFAIVAGSVIAIAQTNIKRMLAYSSVGQIGYIVLGMALVNQLAMTGSLIHIFNHAIMKGGLFLAVGAVVYKTGVVDIEDFKGLGKKMPYTMAAFTIGALSMVGMPLTVGFVSKWYLILGAVKAGMWYIVPVILLSSLLTAVYFGRVIEWIYFHPVPERLQGQSAGDAPFGMVAPTLVLSILTIIFGLFAYIPISAASRAAAYLLGVHQ